MFAVMTADDDMYNSSKIPKILLFSKKNSPGKGGVPIKSREKEIRVYIRPWLIHS